MTDEATELHLYISNTQIVWRQVEAIARNYERKRAKGIYDHARAVDGLIHAAKFGAVEYAKEFSVGTDWAQMFPMSVRREVAEALCADLENEWAAGNSWTN